MGQDPIELVAIAKRILYKVYIISNPDVDAFLFHEFPAKGVRFQVGSFEIGSEASVTGGLGLVFESEDEFSGSGFDAFGP